MPWERFAGLKGVMKNAQSTTLTTATQTTITTRGTYYDVSGLSVTITPTASSSKVLVIGQIDLTCATTDALIGVRLVRGSTAIGVATSASSRIATTAGAYLSVSPMTSAAAHFSIPVFNLDSPATTSATTYKIQVTTNVNSSTVSVNRSSADGDTIDGFRATSSISAIEVLQ